MRSRVAVVGVGAFGEAHVQAYRAQGAELVGVADSDIDRAGMIADRYQIPYFTDDPYALINELKPDGVSVATPAASHIALAAHAVSCGVRVLLEKPIATGSRELRQLPPSADELVTPAHVLRFEPVHRHLHDLVAAGDLGTILAISASRNRARWHLDRYRDIHPALLTAVHDIDLAVWLTGSRANVVSALSTPHPPSEQPATVFAQVDAVDGSIWSIRSCWLLPDSSPPTDQIEVYGTRGVATIRVESDRTTLSSPSPTDLIESRPLSLTPGLAEEIEHLGLST
jgi:predicted dehydrogenase